MEVQLLSVIIVLLMEVAIISCIMELVYVLPHVLMVHTKILLIILVFYVVISVLLVPHLQLIA